MAIAELSRSRNEARFRAVREGDQVLIYEEHLADPKYKDRRYPDESTADYHLFEEEFQATDKSQGFGIAFKAVALLTAIGVVDSLRHGSVGDASRKAAIGLSLAAGLNLISKEFSNDAKIARKRAASLEEIA